MGSTRSSPAMEKAGPVELAKGEPYPRGSVPEEMASKKGGPGDLVPNESMLEGVREGHACSWATVCSQENMVERGGGWQVGR
jgi:hypothetical protein